MRVARWPAVHTQDGAPPPPQVALLTRERRTATCKAVSYCELWSLSRDELERLVADAPEMEESMQRCALQRLATQLAYKLSEEHRKCDASGPLRSIVLIGALRSLPR